MDTTIVTLAFAILFLINISMSFASALMKKYNVALASFVMAYAASIILILAAING